MMSSMYVTEAKKISCVWDDGIPYSWQLPNRSQRLAGLHGYYNKGMFLL